MGGAHSEPRRRVAEQSRIAPRDRRNGPNRIIVSAWRSRHTLLRHAAVRYTGDRKAARELPIPLLDNTTWIVIVGALAAAALAVVLCVAIFVLVTRNRHGQTTARAHVRGIQRTLRGDARQLAREVERAQDETRRSRQLAAIGASIDLDTVLSRALEAAARVAPVDAALVIAPQEGEPPVIATYGMTPEEAADIRSRRRRQATRGRSRSPIGTRPSGRRRTAVSSAARSRCRFERLRRVGGTMAVFWREEGRKPTDDEVSSLEHVATNVGPAIVNARRFREARKLADLDALTSLHNRRYFHDTLAREVARAHRYDRQLALVVFDIDDFKAINERVGHLAGDAVLAQLAERVAVGRPRRRHRLPRRRRRVRGHPPRVRPRGRGAALPPAPVRGFHEIDRLRGAAAPLGRYRGADPGGRRDLLLRARGRGAVPGEADRKGPVRGRRGRRVARTVLPRAVHSALRSRTTLPGRPFPTAPTA